MEIIWLASYPKSGNTYLRFLLSSYLFGIPDVSSDVEDTIADVHLVLAGKRVLPRGTTGPLLIKSHFPSSPKHPYWNKTKGFIYLVRNPRDVLISNARHVGIRPDDSDDFRNFAHAFIASMGVERWHKSGFGFWPTHLASWMASVMTLPHLFIKYENLCADPASTLASLISFIGQSVDNEKVVACVEANSLLRMRSMEVRERLTGIKGAFRLAAHANPSDPATLFVGEGRRGQDLSRFGEDVEAAYVRRFGQLTALLGYS